MNYEPLLIILHDIPGWVEGTGLTRAAEGGDKTTGYYDAINTL